jgi:hypothetical protein
MKGKACIHLDKQVNQERIAAKMKNKDSVKPLQTS